MELKQVLRVQRRSSPNWYRSKSMVHWGLPVHNTAVEGPL
jgi:hypothetical protein